MFASHRHAVTGTRSCTAVQEGVNLSQNAATHHQFSHDVNKRVDGRAPRPARVTAHSSAGSTQSLRSPTHPSRAVPPWPGLPCPLQARPGLALPRWASSCGCGLRSRGSPSSHPAEIPKLKRPKGDINSWHPGPGELT